jgi:hypothetical protein
MSTVELISALHDTDLAKVESNILRGADVNNRGPSMEYTPLALAVSNRFEGAVAILLRHGAIVSMDFETWTDAVEENDNDTGSNEVDVFELQHIKVRIFQMLWSCFIETLDFYEDDPSDLKNQSAWEILNMQARESRMPPLLFVAVASGRVPMLRAMQDLNVDLHTKNHMDGLYIVQFCLKNDGKSLNEHTVAMCKILLESGAAIYPYQRAGCFGFSLSDPHRRFSKRLTVEIVLTLLRHGFGASIDDLDGRGEPLINSVVKNTQLSHGLLREIMSYNPTLTGIGANGQNVLCIAISYGQQDVVECLMDTMSCDQRQSVIADAIEMVVGARRNILLRYLLQYSVRNASSLHNSMCLALSNCLEYSDHDSRDIVAVLVTAGVLVNVPTPDISIMDRVNSDINAYRVALGNVAYNALQAASDTQKEERFSRRLAIAMMTHPRLAQDSVGVSTFPEILNMFATRCDTI